MRNQGSFKIEHKRYKFS